MRKKLIQRNIFEYIITHCSDESKISVTQVFTNIASKAKKKNNVKFKKKFKDTNV